MTLRAAPLSATKERFAELYGLYAPDAARLAYLLTGDKELAEDLAQEAFIKVLGRFGDLRKPESFHAYLRRTVVNLLHKHQRRLAVERRYTAKQKAARFEEQVSFPDVVTSETLWNVVRSLPTRQRDYLVTSFR